MQRLGKAFIKVNGQLLESMPGATLDIGGVSRAAVVGANTVHGFFETPKPAVVSCQISVSKDTKLEDMNTWADVSVTFECDTGQVWVVRQAFLTEPPVMTAGDGGQVPLVFNGPPAEKVN